MPDIKKIILLNKRPVILTAILLILLITNIFLIFKILSSKVEIVNSSKKYSVSYHPTKEFSQTLNKWGLWQENKIYYSDGNLTTIKKLKIIFTDVEQKYLVQKDKAGNITWSANSSMDDRNTLVFSIQLSPTPLSISSDNNTGRAIDKQINSIVLTTLYPLMFPRFVIIEKKTPYLQDELTKYKKNTIFIPFHARLLN